ncbi:putative entry exclusion protein TrbK-alt [Sphingosinicella rhizophila]|uniref:Entry exclusion protein TrbK-alt n=1 Tax=Sphingosinicella rhizophila TaxID=3050082 RepID=A0ABU3QAG5_9SPHN|nr:putative entry exclusion protein TrbK-alt [Sphingosinicella sp. GR2756]MDT9600401.1 putative entry exclusion protein TrbK-alt [Sphingosinicella sp. GR2756]
MKIETDMTFWVRLGAVLFAGMAVLVAVLDAQLRREAPQVAVATAAPASEPDPLAAELARCASLTDPALIDAACRAAWAEQRRRFFSTDRTAP